jgi:hypothetical protein
MERSRRWGSFGGSHQSSDSGRLPRHCSSPTSRQNRSSRPTPTEGWGRLQNRWAAALWGMALTIEVRKRLQPVGFRDAMRREAP